MIVTGIDYAGLSHDDNNMKENLTIDPSDGLYSSRIAATYVKFLRKAYSHVDIDDILAYAGMEMYQVEDEDHWFTQEQADRFNERVVRSPGTGTSPGSGKVWLFSRLDRFCESYILGHMSTGKAYEMVARISSKFVESDTYESTRLASNKVRVVVTPRPGVHEKPYQCQNRIGYFEAFSVLFDHKFLHVEHPKCVFRGDECCEYLVTWREFRHGFWKKVRTIGGAAFLAATALLFLQGTTAGLTGVSIALTGLMLFSSWVWRLERHELHAAMDNLSQSANDVITKMETGNRNARMTQEIGHILTRQETVAGVLNEVTRILEKRLDYDRGVILMADKKKGVLEAKDTFGYSKDLDALNNGILTLDASDLLPVKCFRERRPFLVNDFDEPPGGLGVNTEIAQKLGIKSFLLPHNVRRGSHRRPCGG